MKKPQNPWITLLVYVGKIIILFLFIRMCFLGIACIIKHITERTSCLQYSLIEEGILLIMCSFISTVPVIISDVAFGMFSLHRINILVLVFICSVFLSRFVLKYSLGNDLIRRRVKC